ncbi:DNA alkylation repair protein [Streptacidiphilus griseoplanus]|uniref:DNA alkylation repair protein n=1 Tax=Peterkaempfera griseoplana TaxID=66896 RepID=UPI0006E17CE4|nr:DNA alkylation repair protein [Peterkaempfera griseoplana]
MTEQAVRKPLKESALNSERIARIADEIHAAVPGFDPAAFTTDVMADLPRLELKARIDRTARALHEHLPYTGPAALQALLASLPSSPEAAGVGNDFGLHTYSPYSRYVARYHCNDAELDQALDALVVFTRYFSAEDAVRTFLNAYPDQTLAAVRAWAGSEDYRVRRLASESTRPVLPWSERITLPPTTGLPILELLHRDETRFVAASVANHLRDISATDPELVLSTLARWKQQGQGAGQFDFISRDALRNQVKSGNAAAFDFLGFPSPAPVAVSPLTIIPERPRVGDSLTFTAKLSVTVPAPLHIMYVITPVSPDRRRREKAYFLRRLSLSPDAPAHLEKAHPLRASGTAAVRPGPYELLLQVNGVRYPPAAFHVHE